jgi:hypothetical protein
VLVDVVVWDKRGQPVRDLTLSDFEVLEDGVPQKIDSFTPVFAATPATAPATVRATPPAAGTGDASSAGAGSPRPTIQDRQ